MSERCEALFGDLSAMADGEVDDDVRASVDVHLAECPTCAERFRAMQDLRAALSAMVDDEPPPGFVEETRQKVLSPPKGRGRGCGLLLVALLVVGCTTAGVLIQVPLAVVESATMAALVLVWMGGAGPHG